MWLRTNIESRWKRTLLYDFPALLYAGFIFWLSSLSYSASQEQWTRLIPDTLVHAVEFGLLAMLLFRQLWQPGRLDGILAAAYLSLILSTCYGATDEWHQSFVPGRTMDLRDCLADALGAFVTLAIMVGYLLWKKKLTLREAL